MRRRSHWRRLVRIRDGAGTLGKSHRFGLLTPLGSGLSVYGMEIPPTRDFRIRSTSGALAGELSGTLKVRKPAYPLGPRFAGPRQGLAGGCAPSDPPNGNGISWALDATCG